MTSVAVAQDGTLYLASGFNGTVLFGVGYVRDSLGRITQLFDTTQGTPTRWSYVYDGLGRLIADSVNGALFTPSPELAPSLSPSETRGGEGTPTATG